MEALQRVPPESELQTREQTMTFYMKRVLAMPVTIVLGCSAVTLAIATQEAWIAGATAILGTIAAVFAGSCRRLRRVIDRAAIAQERAERRKRRKERVALAGLPGRAELEELTACVEDIERSDPGALDRHDLEGVLDHYVEVARACHRTRKAADSIDRSRLVDELRRLEVADCRELTRLRERHHEILLRRVQHLSECDRAVIAFQAEMALIADYIRLVAERLSLGRAPRSRVEEMAQRLDDLDAADAELADLTAA